MNTNTNTPLTREQWIRACADRYLAESDLDQESALHFATACADLQARPNGEDVSGWDSPSDAADEDMSYWEEE